MLDNSIQAINRRLEAVAVKVKELSDDVKTDFAIMEDSMLSLPRYFNALIHEELGLIFASAKYAGDPELINETRIKLDDARRSCHIGMTNGINILNRLCNIMGTEAVFQIEDGRELNSNDSIDREFAADLCYNFCKDAFLDAKTKILLRDRGIKEAANNWQEREAQTYKMVKARAMFDEGLVSKKNGRFERRC